MCPVDSSTPHVGGMETYWIHEVFAVSGCSPILSFLTPYPTENFAKSKPLYRPASQISDGQVTISIHSAGIPVLILWVEGPNKPRARPSYPGLKRFR